ncbi:MAG: UPF0182 family protein [Pseudomonadales bacterium]|nr:UPF0182 family protein [Pseudomonadales bacterium]
MYVLTLIALLLLSAWIVSQGVTFHRPHKVKFGIGLAILTGSFFLFMDFWGELLWYESLGFEDRFLKIITTRVLLAGVGALLAYMLAFFVLYPAGKQLRRLGCKLAVLAGLVWSLSSWEQLLLFINGESTAVVEPMLGLNTGFYLFVLPFLDHIYWLAIAIAVIVLAVVLLFRETPGRPGFLLEVHSQEPVNPISIPVASAFLALTLAYGELLGVFHLLYSDLGVVNGPGWTDVHIGLPAKIIMGFIFLMAGLLPTFHRFRSFMNRLMRQRAPIGPPYLVATISAWLAIGLAWTMAALVIPALVQWLIVKPNEITFEKPYIAHNIEFTRRGFHLENLEERQFSPGNKFGESLINDNKQLLSEIRLWDLQALDAVYKQFQEIRLYYEFHDVDIDRYIIGDRYRQVMVSAREMSKSNLPEQSKTFINQRFKYTHGYGYTLAPVSDFTATGLPNLIVRDIPPKTDAQELALERPEIYYGELTRDVAVVNSREAEFDYPQGETNVYVNYQGSGGVALSSFWRKLLFGWKFDGSLFLFSSYPTTESRIMFHRSIRERIERLAPFLTFDEDPYITAVDGRLHWIVDGYTSSEYYPYSQRFESGEEIGFQNGRVNRIGQRTVHQLNGKNYIRNSVKAVIDAYDGSVDFYIFDDADPIIKAWSKIFPVLFKDKKLMPANLRAHVRYPVDFLLTQGLIFAKYHMTDPEVFYNQEDIWVRATEKHYGNIKPVEPYYVMWELPGSDHAEFVLILPFTPKNRQLLIGWIAALSDGENYGRFIAYKFPKERRVLGPQQVETKIDQDAFLSGQLTLWNQQGSEVIRGNVLAIPIDDTLLYVEPIYLRAETAAYPELRLVAVMHGDRLSYAETFDEALLGLLDSESGTSSKTSEVLVRDAKLAFDAYLKALGEHEFSEAALHLDSLSATLEKLNE